MLKKNVLVIDDEVDFLDEMKEWLNAHGFNPLIAVSGDEGIETAKLSKPSLIVLDISMPAKDGFTTLRALKSHVDTTSIPVVMLTAAGETDSILRAQRMGASDYFIKPFIDKELLALIRRFAA